MTASVKLKPPNSQSFPCRPHCITVPELRFVLLDLGLLDECVDVVDSERKWRRERGEWSSWVGEEDEMLVGEEAERIAVGDRERDVRMRAKIVCSVGGERGVERPVELRLVVGETCEVADEAEKDRAGKDGFASEETGVVGDIVVVAVSRIYMSVVCSGVCSMAECVMPE